MGRLPTHPDIVQAVWRSDFLCDLIASIDLALNGLVAGVNYSYTLIILPLYMPRVALCTDDDMHVQDHTEAMGMAMGMEDTARMDMDLDMAAMAATAMAGIAMAVMDMALPSQQRPLPPPAVD